ncbi:MAG: hypothetical protein HFI35_06270 [Roseburia sp.]|jgi:multisubunit Na+/H+ antiporter MnhB subunit|nr:hypothetical protein [Roseburia sp.]
MKKNSAFSRWFYGEKDTLLGKVEMKPQNGHAPRAGEIRELMEERRLIREHIYDVEDNQKLRLFHRLYQAAAVVFCLMLMLIMLVVVSWLPENGDPDNPVNNEVSARYIENGLQETGAVNIVTGMILDYRAFDTFGESNVLFISTVTVLILLHNKKKEKKTSAEGGMRADKSIYEENLILQKIAGILVPIIVIFGIYVILNGHLSPGGGFSGGAIIGAGLILYQNAFGFEKTERFFTEKTYKWVCFVSLTFYCLAKSYSFFTGANHLESGIPLGKAGAILSSGLILPLNICVGLVVACTMYTFFAMFRKGDF